MTIPDSFIYSVIYLFLQETIPECQPGTENTVLKIKTQSSPLKVHQRVERWMIIQVIVTSKVLWKQRKET